MDRDALELSLANELEEIAVAAAEIESFCEARGLPPSVAYAVNLSVDELLTNTISYGYDDDARHLIAVAVRMEEDALVVEISDDGAPFDPSDAPEPDTEASLEDRPIGGLGVFLVRQMMDDVAYRREAGRNVVTLTKRIAGRADAPG